MSKTSLNREDDTVSNDGSSGNGSTANPDTSWVIKVNFDAPPGMRWAGQDHVLEPGGPIIKAQGSSHVVSAQRISQDELVRNQDMSLGQLIDKCLSLNDNEKMSLIGALRPDLLFGAGGGSGSSGRTTPITGEGSQGNVQGNSGNIASVLKKDLDAGFTDGNPTIDLFNRTANADTYQRYRPFAKARGVPNEIRNQKELDKFLRKRHDHFHPGFDRARWTMIPRTNRIVPARPRTKKSLVNALTEEASTRAREFAEYCTENRIQQGSDPDPSDPRYAEWKARKDLLVAARQAVKDSKKGPNSGSSQNKEKDNDPSLGQPY